MWVGRILVHEFHISINCAALSVSCGNPLAARPPSETKLIWDLRDAGKIGAIDSRELHYGCLGRRMCRGACNLCEYVEQG